MNYWLLLKAFEGIVRIVNLLQAYLEVLKAFLFCFSELLITFQHDGV